MCEVLGGCGVKETTLVRERDDARESASVAVERAAAAEAAAAAAQAARAAAEDAVVDQVLSS
jgi:hypothetical protein